MRQIKLAARLKKWRAAQDITQARAAERLGISRRTYEKWEQGLRTPSPLAMLALLQMIE